MALHEPLSAPQHNRPVDDFFKSLAAEILDASSKRLQEHSQTSLATLLDPLKTTNVQHQRAMTTWVIRRQM